jgi:hypothetical protein
VIENDDGVVDRFIGVTQREDIETAIQQALWEWVPFYQLMILVCPIFIDVIITPSLLYQ